MSAWRRAVCALGILGMFFQDANAFGAGLGVIGEHDAQRDSEARVAGIARGQRPHGGDGRLLAAVGSIQRLVIGQRDVPVRRAVAVELAIDLHRLFVVALAGEVAGLPQPVALRPGAGQRLDLGDVGIVGIDGAQLLQRGLGLRQIAAQLEVAGQAGERFGVLGIGKQNLLPDLDGHVGPAARLQRVRVGDQNLAGLLRARLAPPVFAQTRLQQP